MKVDIIRKITKEQENESKSKLKGLRKKLKSFVDLCFNDLPFLAEVNQTLPSSYLKVPVKTLPASCNLRTSLLKTHSKIDYFSRYWGGSGILAGNAGNGWS